MKRGDGAASGTILGVETEYAVTSPGTGPEGVGRLAAEVVRAGSSQAGAGSVRPDGMLPNGGRFYVDHAHPEYATPETSNPSELVVWQLAGDRIVVEAAQRAELQWGRPIRIHRNNTDGKGHSYGYHENILMRREAPWERIEAILPAFLVSRIILGGAGRVGVGTRSEKPGFQISQRADFFRCVSSLDTLQERGLVNTRDEPHAAPAHWRRLHLITGDATRSPFATWLSLGAALLTVAALEERIAPRIALADPVGAFTIFSRDPALRTTVATLDGGRESALGLQERFRDAAARVLHHRHIPEGPELVAEWTAVLDSLRRDPAALADRLDWVAKRVLLEGFRQRDGLGWADPRLAALDLAWADLAPDGVVGRLQAAGRFTSLPDPAAVARAMREPPSDTRAAVRSRLMRDWGDAVVHASWDVVLTRTDDGGMRRTDLPDPLPGVGGDQRGMRSALD